MAKVYDPIMCMMVEQKTNDARTCDEFSIVDLSGHVYQKESNYNVAESVAKWIAKQNHLVARIMSGEDVVAKVYPTGRVAKDARTCDSPLSEEKVMGYKFDQIMRRLNNIEYHYNDAKKGLISDLNSVKKDINEFSSKHGDDASTSELNKRHADVMRIVSSMR